MEESQITDSIGVVQDSILCTSFPYTLDSLHDTLEVESSTPTLEESILQYLPSVDMGLPRMGAEESKSNAQSSTSWVAVPRNEGAPLLDTIQGQFWFTPMMMTLFAMYGMLFSSHHKGLFQEFKEFFYPKSRNDMFSSSVVEASRLRRIINFVSIFSVSIFCYFALAYLFRGNGTEQYETFHFAKIIEVIVGYVIFKVIGIGVICYTFFNSNMLAQVARSYSTLTSSMAVSLFVVDVLAAYASHDIAVWALYAGLVICFCAVLLYLYKILAIFFTGMSSLFYLILYLCTLEILPSIVLVLGLLRVF